ncbi:hypothetical protein BB561_006000 [Smittium simulii]|uniref:ribose-phosphate diphosphokinase n=1 Tax=Smittium simulii TaxID=133385 RepID=A0A2T9Y744_9FUNG|nr:hypothetical protein BB561_006000 [Smittium simulii]
MRNARLFAGSSHHVLARKIANHLDMPLSPVSIQRFANQEITVSFGVSVRAQTVYIIQSGSDTINDHLMELMIMIRAARSSSASSVVVVMPYYSYSKQCKKKKSRGAIAAKLVADMLMVSGADHIITLDLHVYQISGFFTIPLDNLFSKPIVAKWITENIPDYKNAVVVSKNIGGAKRVTGLADALKIKFALIYMESKHVKSSMKKGQSIVALHELNQDGENYSFDQSRQTSQTQISSLADAESLPSIDFEKCNLSNSSNPPSSKVLYTSTKTDSSKSTTEFVLENSVSEVEGELDLRPMDEIMNESDDDLEPSNIDDSNNNHSTSFLNQSTVPDKATHNRYIELGSNKNASMPPAFSTKSCNDRSLKVGTCVKSNGKYDKKTKVTLIGDVSDKIVFLLDDLIDSPRSFVNVAEHLTTSCNARDVYIFASHGLFSESSINEIENCPYIKKVITTNSYPISHHLKAKFSKLFQVDVSNLLAESIRRNHNGESISSLFEKI